MIRELSAQEKLTKNSKLIREAFAKGRKTLVVDGVRMKLCASKRQRTVTVGGGLNKTDYPATQLKLSEHWITASPANGKFAPMYCVERYYHKNGTAFAK